MAFFPQMQHTDEPVVGDPAATGRLGEAEALADERPAVSSGFVRAVPVPGHILRASNQEGAWPGSLAVLAIASAAVGWVFRAEIAAAVQVWSNSATFGHAFFIVPISLFLFYRARHRLASLHPVPAPWAMVPIAMLALVWVVGEMANLLVVKQLAFVGLWQALFLLVLGWRITRTALFPLLYLYFAVPFGSSAIPALQDVTAQMVVQLLRLSGIAVFLDGYLIQIPSGSFLVAEACSGVRYLIVSVALGVLAAHLFFRSWPRRLAFIGLSFAIPIVANGMRAYGIIMLAHLSDYRIAVDVDHVLYGFIFLGIVTLSLLGLAALLRERYEPAPAEPPAGRSQGQRQAPAPRYALVIQAACSSVAVVAVLLAQAWTAAAKEAPRDLTAVLLLPEAAAPWQATTEGEAGWKPRFHGNDVTLQGGYRLGDDRVDLYVAHYAYQREGAEAVSGMNNFVGAAKQWRALQLSQAEARINGRAHPYVRMLLANGSDSYIVWYWYRIGGENTNSRSFGKLLELKALMTGGERAASVIAIGSRLSEDARWTDALLGAFLTQTLNSDGTLVRLDRSRVGAGATASQ